MPAAELQCCGLYTSCDTLMIYLSVSAALLLMYDLSARGCRLPAPSRRQLLDSRYYYYYPSRTAWLPGSCFTGASASRLENSITFIFAIASAKLDQFFNNFFFTVKIRNRIYGGSWN